jgi:hypothetical protein
MVTHFLAAKYEISLVLQAHYEKIRIIIELTRHCTTNSVSTLPRNYICMVFHISSIPIQSVNFDMYSHVVPKTELQHPLARCTWSVALLNQVLNVQLEVWSEIKEAQSSSVH